MGLRLQCMALPMWAEELTGLTCLEPGGCTCACVQLMAD